MSLQIPFTFEEARLWISENNTTVCRTSQMLWQMSLKFQLPTAIISYNKCTQFILWIQSLLKEISLSTSHHYLQNHTMVEVGRDCLLSCHWTPLKRAWLPLLYTLPSAVNRGGLALSCYRSQKTELINTMIWPKKETKSRKSNQQKQNFAMFWKTLHLFS